MRWASLSKLIVGMTTMIEMKAIFENVIKITTQLELKCGNNCMSKCPFFKGADEPIKMTINLFFKYIFFNFTASGGL